MHFGDPKCIPTLYIYIYVLQRGTLAMQSPKTVWTFIPHIKWVIVLYR